MMETINAGPVQSHRDGHLDQIADGEAHPAATAHEQSAIPADLPRVSTLMVAAVVIAFIVLLAALFAVGYFPNRKRHQEADAVAAEQQDAVPRVDVIQPRRPSAAGDLVLFADAGRFRKPPSIRVPTVISSTCWWTSAIG